MNALSSAISAVKPEALASENASETPAAEGKG
jgi:hypothetical protein